MNVVAIPGKNATPLVARPATLVGIGVIFLFVLGAIYKDVLAGLVLDWWNDPNYSHGFLVPFFSAYLVWDKRGELRTLPVTGSWLGFPLLLAGIALLLLGVVGAEDFLVRSSLIVVLAGLVWMHLGSELFRRLLFPLAFLFFMIPPPFIVFNSIAFPLQGIAAGNATWALDTLGVPVLRDGNVLHLARLTLGVTEACSGIRSLISLLALAVAWAHLAIPGMVSKALFVASAVPITIVANAARVVLTGIIGQWLGVEYATGFFHTFSGWLVFVAAAVCLFGVHALIAKGGRLAGRA